MDTIRIACAQINSTVGDLQGNSKKIINTNNNIFDEFNPDIIVFPELALTGYPPKDLILNQNFLEKQKEFSNKINKCKNTFIYGMVDYNGRSIYNAAAHAGYGTVGHTYKTNLPNYKMFNEKRYFTANDRGIQLFYYNQLMYAVLICEDLWIPETVEKIFHSSHERPIDFLICISASPFDCNKHDVRMDLIKSRCRDYNVPIVYCNSVGANDGYIFDGRSIICDNEGNIIQCAKSFEEDVIVADLDINRCRQSRYLTNMEKSTHVEKISIIQSTGYEVDINRDPLPPVDNVKLCIFIRSNDKHMNIINALECGIYDYCTKTGFTTGLLGMSGGLDSAVVNSLVCNALGKHEITCVSMPTPFTSKLSLRLIEREVSRTGAWLLTHDIDDVIDGYLKLFDPENSTLDDIRKNDNVDIAIENIQARIRGNILMYYSNKNGAIVFATGNKSEFAMSYSTLYGDTCGGLSVLGDVYKSDLFEIAKLLGVTKEIIERPPSAELKEDQVDSDSLPSYDILDKILHAHIDKFDGVERIIKDNPNITEQEIKRIINTVDRTEYKRRQCAPILRVTQHCFMEDRQYPIINKFSV